MKKLITTSLLFIASMINIYSQDNNGRYYSAGEIQSKQQVQYGRFEFMMYSSDMSGTTSTFFMWKEGSTEANVQWNELDIETFGKSANSWQSNPIWEYETNDYNPRRWEGIHTSIPIANKWVKFTLEWTPSYIAWFNNGVEVRRILKGQNAPQGNDPVGNIADAMRMCFNHWATYPGTWLGAFNPADLPSFQFVDWFTYQPWTGSGFGPVAVRHDYNSLSEVTTAYNISTHTFGDNQCTFRAANVGVVNGYLWLSISGYNNARPPVGAEIPGAPGVTTVAVTGVSLSSTTLALVKPATSQLTATVAPTNATDKTVTWTTSNGAVATVSANGLVTSVNAGTATITAKTQDGAKVATCAVTVTSTVSVTGVSLSSTTLALVKPATSQLTATVAPTNATNKTVTWATSNAAVATVSASGLVTSVNAGNATITATTQDGAKVATCTVTVTVVAAFSLKIEAELYSAMFGVQTQTTTDAGGGLNVGYLDPNDWMAYNNITIPTTGTYTISYRIASLAGGGSLQLETNAGATILDPAFAIPSTGGWQNWQTVTRTVTLPAGTYNLGLKVVTGGFNINWLTITKTSGARISANAEVLSEEQSQGTDIVFYPNPVADNFTIVKEEEGTSLLNISDISGRTAMDATINQGRNLINISDLKSGTYIIQYQSGVKLYKGKLMKIN